MKKLTPLLIVIFTFAVTMIFIGCLTEPEEENEITLDLVNGTGSFVYVESTYVGTTDVFGLFGAAAPPLPAAVSSPAGSLMENLPLPGGLFISVFGYSRSGISPNFTLDPPEYIRCFDLTEPAHYQCEFFDAYNNGDASAIVEDNQSPGTVIVTNLDTTEIVPAATCP